MSLISEVAAMDTQDTASARRRYVELITSDDASNAAELRSLMKSLGKSPKQAEDDRDTLNDVRKDESEIVPDAQLTRLRANAQAVINVMADELRKHVTATVNATEPAVLIGQAMHGHLAFETPKAFDVAVSMKMQADAEVTIAENNNRQRQQRMDAARKSHPDLFEGE